jgi:HlyD family secretion protein
VGAKNKMTTNNNNNANQILEKSESKPRRKSKTGLWVALLFVAVVLTVGIFLAATKYTSRSIASGMNTFIAEKGDLLVTVTEGGSIRAGKSVQYKCQVQRRGQAGGDVTILSIEPPGTYITQEDVDNGRILVKLDSSTLEERLVQQKMNLATAQENATSAKEAFDIQLKQNDSDIANAQLNVRFSLLDLQKYLGATLANRLVKDVNESANLTEYIAPFIKEIKADPNILTGSSAWQQLKRCQDDITMAVGNLKTAQQTLVGTQKLHDANYVSDLDLDRDKLSLQSKEFALESSRISLDLFLDYDFAKGTEQNLSNYIEDGRRLQRTYAQCRAREAQAKARLSTADLNFNEQKEQVDFLDQQIEFCTIKAKAPGLVVYGTGVTEDVYRAMRGGGMNSRSGMIAEGEPVSEGQVLMSMPDTATMIAEIAVHETEVDKVRVGQLASIVMDAFPDRPLTGKVIEVASMPDQQQRGFMNPDLKVYKTLVSIDGSHNFLKSLMNCKVTILVEQLNDVIRIPIQSVANRSGKKVCFIKDPDSGEPVERVVATGAFNDSHVQILDGLEVDEEVLLNPPPMTGVGTDVFQTKPPLPQPSAGADAMNTNGLRGPRGGPAGMQGMSSRGTEGQIDSMDDGQNQGQTRRGAGLGGGRGGMGGGRGGRMGQ